MDLSRALGNYAQLLSRTRTIDKKFTLLNCENNLPVRRMLSSKLLDKVADIANLKDKVVEKRLLNTTISFEHETGAVVEFHQSGLYPISSVRIEIYGKDRDAIKEAESDLKYAVEGCTLNSMFPYTS